MILIIVEQSWTQKGYLLFKNGEDWRISLGGIVRAQGIDLFVPPSHKIKSCLSTNIVQYVVKTGENIVLGNATSEGLFTLDEYVLAHSPLSIMCVPLSYQEKINCIVYLENNLAPEAFSSARQEIIHTICTQAALSLNNSALYSELEMTVEQLQQEVKKRKEKQRQLLHAEKLSALGRLSASIAHEFGNPLIGIHYLLIDITKRLPLSPEDEQLLQIGQEECQRMKALIRDLQKLNRPSSGKKDFFDPGKAITNILLFQKKNLKSHKIRVVKKISENLMPIWAVEDQIMQVLVNLTLNAVDAMKDSGGTMTVAVYQDEESLHITVKDTGSGIPEEHQKKIFEPFFSTKPNVEGTGLGLPVSYSIVKNHNGDMTFQSSPGEGSVFHICLPNRYVN